MPLKSSRKPLLIATSVACLLVLLSVLSLLLRGEQGKAVPLITIPGIYPAQTSDPYYHWLDNHRILLLTQQRTNNSVFLRGEEIDTRTGQRHLLPQWGRVPYWADMSSVAPSPDGQQLLFSNRTGSDNKALLASADGSRQEKIPVIGDCNLFFWSPDGRRFLSQGEKKGENDMVRVYDATRSAIPPETIRHPALKNLSWPQILGIDRAGTITAIDLHGISIAGNGPGKYHLVFYQRNASPTPATPGSPQKSFTLLRLPTSATTPTSQPDRTTIPLPSEAEEVKLVLSPDTQRVLLLTRGEDKSFSITQWLQRSFNRYLPWHRMIRQRIIVCNADGTDNQELDNRVMESGGNTPYPCWLPSGRQVSFFVKNRLYRADISATP